MVAADDSGILLTSSQPSPGRGTHVTRGIPALRQHPELARFLTLAIGYAP